MFAFTRFEIVRTLRNTKFLMFLVAMPVGLYLVLTTVSDAGGAAAQADTYLVLMLMMAVYSASGAAMYAAGPELAAERANGWLRQLLTTPLGFPSWMGAKVSQGVLLTVPGTVAVGVVAALLHGIHLSAAHWLALGVVVVIGSVPFALLGQVIGQLFLAQAASAAQLFLLFGLSFLGGVLLPTAALPPTVRTIGLYTPSHHLIELAKEAIGAQPFAWDHVGVLAAFTAGIGAVVLVLWRRDDATGA